MATATVTDPHPLPKAPPAPLKLPEPDRPPAGWVIIGPRVREQLGPQLERAMPLVWVAYLEMVGAADGAGYRLVIDAAHLEPVPSG